MFEAKLTEGHILKKIIEAIKDLVTDVNIDVSPSGKLHNNTFIKKSNRWQKTLYIDLQPTIWLIFCKSREIHTNKIDFCTKFLKMYIFEI